MPSDKSLEICTYFCLDIEVDGDIEGRRRSRYSVKLNVDGQEVESTEAMLSASTLKWEWSVENEILFAPSSMIKIKLYRRRRTGINKRIGMLEERIVDLLDNGKYTASFDLTDDNGVVVPGKMKIALSPISKSDDDIAKFLDKVDADTSILPQTEDMLGTASTLGQVLKLTKAMMSVAARCPRKNPKIQDTGRPALP
ncbi:hypothetical protein CVT25_012047 [Psilocybe cyanescens]|uniref:C2 NT-type domain-containing protein n=1 Tax=Psilocybe cyanescens TaxID=93625 RepID=A0A409X7T5_PSICY|nr:hypothetical protein CVT25_012047 [Psilocybe cyanescens]